MKTNFELIRDLATSTYTLSRDLDELTPAQREEIRALLELDGKTSLELINLNDALFMFAVHFSFNPSINWRLMQREVSDCIAQEGPATATSFRERVKHLIEGFFRPSRRGCISWVEIEYIRRALGLDQLTTEVELRNLRDTVVWMGGCDKDDMRTLDFVSAITAVIDQQIFEIGGEV